MKNVTLGGNPPKRNLTVEITASLLLIFFVHSVISLCNYYGFVSFKNFLAFYAKNQTTVAISVILIEGIISALLFFRRTRAIGFIGSLLAILFAGSLIFVYPHKPHDFGGIFNHISYWQKWLLIVIVALLSILGIFKSYWVKNRHNTSEENQVVFT